MFNEIASVGFVGFLIYLWNFRKFYYLVWKLNGLYGLLSQPVLTIFAWSMFDPRFIIDRLKYLRENHRLKGPLGVVIGPRGVLYLDDPVSIEKVLNSPQCIDKTFIQDGFFTRKGLLHAKGQRWKNRRKQLNPTFNFANLVSFFPIFNTIGNSLADKFDVLAKENKDVVGLDAEHDNQINYKTIEDFINRAVLVAACRTTMGTTTNFLDTDDEGIVDAYKVLFKISSVKSYKPWLQLKPIFKLHKLYKTDVKCNELIDVFVKNIVNEKNEIWKTNRAASNKSREDDDFEGTDALDVEQSPRRNFIEHIFHLAENGELTMQDIEDESSSMILAASETVSNSLSLLLLCLACHPDSQHKLQQEIDEVLDGNNSQEDNLTIGDIQNMKYLDMVMNEGLRLLPTIPMLLRNVSDDFYLQKDVVVPKDTFIIIDTFHIHRDRTLWGPHAEEFHPEHFLPENAASRNPFIFLPFCRGLRFCIGWRYSLFLAKVFLVKILRNYHIETNIKLEDLKFISGISLKVKDKKSVSFRLEKRRVVGK